MKQGTCIPQACEGFLAGNTVLCDNKPFMQTFFLNYKKRFIIITFQRCIFFFLFCTSSVLTFVNYLIKSIQSNTVKGIYNVAKEVCHNDVIQINLHNNNYEMNTFLVFKCLSCCF